jgi:hypothetical protein
MQKVGRSVLCAIAVVLSACINAAAIEKHGVVAGTTNLYDLANQTGQLSLENTNSSFGVSSIPLPTQNETFPPGNNVSGNNSDVVGVMDINGLSGGEKVSVFANFLPMPSGPLNDYAIDGKPTILINDVPLEFEYPVDNTDDVTLSDILMSMKATIRINSSSSSNETLGGDNNNDIYQVRVFANPENVSESDDGTKEYITGPNNVEHIQLHNTFYYNIVSEAVLYKNGSGNLKAHNQ